MLTTCCAYPLLRHCEGQAFVCPWAMVMSACTSEFVEKRSLIIKQVFWSQCLETCALDNSSDSLAWHSWLGSVSLPKRVSNSSPATSKQKVAAYHLLLPNSLRTISQFDLLNHHFILVNKFAASAFDLRRLWYRQLTGQKVCRLLDF